jgi:L-asparaginase
MQAPERKIVVLGTGGTIAGTAASAQDDVGYTAAQVGIAQLLQGVGGLDSLEIASEQVAQVDSKDMDFEVWRALAQRCAHWLARPEVAGVVVTHGTDTMEETAYLLHRVLDARKPVVLTGAMRPATSAGADGPGNLRDAIRVAGEPAARGVVVVFGGCVHGAADVAKEHVSRLDAFSSGEAGPLGTIDEAGLHMHRAWPEPPADAALSGEKLASCRAWPRVEIVLNHAGASGALVEALVQQGVQGIVAAGTGNGTLHHALEAALVKAQSAGVKVVRTSRCPRGAVVPHARDRLPSIPLPAPKARVALLLESLP